MNFNKSNSELNLDFANLGLSGSNHLYEQEKIPSFIMMENNPVKLALMGFDMYYHLISNSVAIDQNQHNALNSIISLSWKTDKRECKQLLNQIYKQVSIGNNNYLITANLENKINSIMNNYAYLNDKLLCYYFWTYTFDYASNITQLRNSYPYFTSMHDLNQIVFSDKVNNFHEIRKLIIICHLEYSSGYLININEVKKRWSFCDCQSDFLKLSSNNAEFVHWVFDYVVKFIEGNSIYNEEPCYSFFTSYYSSKAHELMDNTPRREIANPIIEKAYYEQSLSVEDKIATCYTLINRYIYCDERYTDKFKKSIQLAINQQEKRDREKKGLSAIKLSKEYHRKLSDYAKANKKSKKVALEELIDMMQ